MEIQKVAKSVTFYIVDTWVKSSNFRGNPKSSQIRDFLLRIYKGQKVAIFMEIQKVAKSVTFYLVHTRVKK